MSTDILPPRVIGLPPLYPSLRKGLPIRPTRCDMPENHKGSNNGAGTPREQGPPSGARGQSIRSQGQASSTAKPNSTAKKGSEQYYNIATEILTQDSNFEVVFLNAARDGDYAKIESLLQRRNDMILSIDAKDKNTGNTALIWSAKRGHTKIVQLLLKHGADITLRNYEGLTAVEVASPQLQQQLLDAVDKGGQHRNLLQAAWQGNAQLVNKILAENNRLDINCKNSDGLTPLLLTTRDAQLFDRLDRVAKSYNPIRVVEELLTHRADPNAIDDEGKTPLHHASASKAISAKDVVQLLLSNNSDPGAQDRRCFTPIHCASHSGNVEVVVALLDGGSEANARGFAGTTPLHISAINGHDRVATTLLQHGADVTLVDDSGHTPLDVAKTKKVKSTLKQAWTEATQRKIERNLGPVRPPSRDSVRQSAEFNKSPPTRRKSRGGEVIFDPIKRRRNSSLSQSHEEPLNLRASRKILEGIPQEKRGSSASEKDRLASLPASQALVSDGAFSPSRPPPNLRKWINGDVEDRFSPMPKGRTQSPSRPIPGSRGSVRNLTPIAAASPRVNGLPDIETRQERVGSASKRTIHKSSTVPSNLNKEMNIPVTILGLDLDENLQEVRVKKIMQSQMKTQKKSHRRNLSDPYACSPTSPDPADEFILRGRTPSKVGEDWDDLPGATRAHSGGNDRTRLHTIEEGKVVKNLTENMPVILNLDQMHLRNMDTPVNDSHALYPTSKRVLPVTPTFMTQPAETSDVRILDVSQEFGGSSKESSPRSDEDNEVKLAVKDPSELLRSRSLLKDKAFNIEDTRIKDSGIESDENKNSGSNRSSINSSSSSQSVSPRGSESHMDNKSIIAAKVKAAVSKPIVKQLSTDKFPLSNKKTVNEQVKSKHSNAQKLVNNNQESEKKVNVNEAQKKVAVQSSNVTKPVSAAKSQVSAGEKLRNIAKENAVKSAVTPGSSQVKYVEPTKTTNNNGPANKITVHSNVLNSLESESKEPIQNPKKDLEKSHGDIIVKEVPNESVSCKPVNSEVGSEGKTQGPNTDIGDIKISSVDTKGAIPTKGKTPRIAQSTNQVGKTQPNTAREQQLKKPGTLAPQNKSTQSRQPGVSKITAQGMQLSRNNAPKSYTKDHNSNKIQQVAGKSGPKVSVAPVINNAANPLREHVSNVPDSKKAEITDVEDSKHKGGVDMDKILEPKPMISDAYEAIRSQHQATVLKDNKQKEERNTQNVRNKSAGKNKIQIKLTKPLSKEKLQEKRQVSAGVVKKKSFKGSREGAKSKDINEQGKTKQRPKSSNKKIKKKKKKKENSVITDKNDMSKVAFVTGHGWYVETECNENKMLSRAKRKTASDTDDSSDSDDEYLNKQYLKLKQADIDLSEHKYDDNLYWTSGSGSETESDTDYDADELPGMELVEEEAVFSARDLAKGAIGMNLPGGKTVTDKEKKQIQKLLIEEQKAKMSETPHTSTVSKTVSAINKFSKSVEDKQLEAMLSSNDKTGDTKEIVKRSASFNTKNSIPPQKGSNSGKATTPRRSISTESFLSNDKKNVDINQNTPKISVALPAPSNISRPNIENISNNKVNSGKSKVSAKNVKLVSQPKPSTNVPTSKTESVPNSARRSQSPRKPTLQDSKGKTPRNGDKSSNSVSIKVGPVPDKIDAVKVGPVPESFGAEQMQKGNLKANIDSKVSQRQQKENANETNFSGKTDGRPSSAERRNSEPAAQLSGTQKTPVSARKSLGENPDEEDLDTMIKEIMKNTPNPSLTLSFRNSAQATPTNERTSPEEICQTLREKFENNTDLLTSQRFKQVPVQKSGKSNTEDESNHSTLKHNDDTYTKSMEVEKKGNPEGSQDTEEPAGKDMEQQQLQKLIASLQHMELKVDVSSGSKKKKFESPRVPVLPDGGVSPNLNGRPPLAPNKSQLDDPRKGVPEKSPRFVRKHDSFREQKDDYNSKPREQDWDARSDVSFCSEVGSDYLSISSSVGGDLDGSMVPKDGRIVTSRLGRHGQNSSRATSAMTGSDTSDDVETIQWKKGNMLGKGAFGTVWCGLTNAGELIAVKQIELNMNHMARAEAEYEKIQEEVAILKTLKHKNIVSYLGTSLEENVVSIFMQFVPGGSIANILARFGALEEEVFCHYTKQILEGVQYLHSNDVIHRDIKGGNVMVMHNGEIKLIDFGCAKRLCLNVNVSQNRLLKSMRGTPYWMAPEVISETGHGTKSDLWSIGCTVFEMATKRPPWADMPPMSAIFAIGSDIASVPPLPDKFSLEARDFVRRCLIRNQDQRPSASELLRHPFIAKRARKKTTLA